MWGHTHPVHKTRFRGCRRTPPNNVPNSPLSTRAALPRPPRRRPTRRPPERLCSCLPLHTQEPSRPRCWPQGTRQGRGGYERPCAYASIVAARRKCPDLPRAGIASICSTFVALSRRRFTGGQASGPLWLGDPWGTLLAMTRSTLGLPAPIENYLKEHSFQHPVAHKLTEVTEPLEL